MCDTTNSFCIYIYTQISTYVCINITHATFSCCWMKKAMKCGGGSRKKYWPPWSCLRLKKIKSWTQCSWLNKFELFFSCDEYYTQRQKSLKTKRTTITYKAYLKVAQQFSKLYNICNQILRFSSRPMTTHANYTLKWFRVSIWIFLPRADSMFSPLVSLQSQNRRQNCTKLLFL